MFHRKTWLLVWICSLVLTSAFFLALTRSFAFAAVSHSTVSISHTYALVRTAAAEKVCSYSPAKTAIIIGYDRWSKTDYFCGSGHMKYKIDRVNEIYDNGGGPMWVIWSARGVDHCCSLNGIGAYRDFSHPVRITQIDYGNSRAGNDCG